MINLNARLRYVDHICTFWGFSDNCLNWQIIIILIKERYFLISPILLHPVC
jgi:hypothetical protein